MKPQKLCSSFKIIPVALLHISLYRTAWAQEDLDTKFWTNLNPSDADIRRDLICEGPLPQWMLPIIPGRWDPNQETSLLRLCASPQYGGVRDPTINTEFWQGGRRERFSGYRAVGLFCYGPFNGLSPEPVPDLSVQDTIVNWPTGVYRSKRETRYDFPALTLYCRQRCYCKHPYGLAQNSKPKEVAKSQQLTPVTPGSRAVNVIRIQRTDYARLWIAMDEYLRPEDIGPNLPTVKVKYSTAKWMEKNIDKGVAQVEKDLIDLGVNSYTANRIGDLDSARERPKILFNLRDITTEHSTTERDYVIWSKNRVLCDSRPGVPLVPFPDPYNRRDFRSAQDICPAALSGGNPGANAGAYCDVGDESPSNTDVTVEPDVWFSDEYTPRLSWTWGGSWRFSTRIRHWCWERCWCANSPRPKKRPAAGVFPITPLTSLTKLPYSTGVKIVKIKGSKDDMGGAGASKGCDKSGCIVMSNENPNVNDPWPGVFPSPKMLRTRPRLPAAALAQAQLRPIATQALMPGVVVWCHSGGWPDGWASIQLRREVSV
ncbi:MAG: hypothetical protein M1814_005440 [Vezdaea aestivalis]|nr:MAG: hypothetical protein M1814_005440 [Vezdaea aestivalis]